MNKIETSSPPLSWKPIWDSDPQWKITDDMGFLDYLAYRFAQLLGIVFFGYVLTLVYHYSKSLFL